MLLVISYLSLDDYGVLSCLFMHGVVVTIFCSQGKKFKLISTDKLNLK